MRIGVKVVVALAFCAAPCGGQQASESGFWKGKFEIHQYNLSFGTGVENKALVFRSVDLWKSDYDLYQNPAGVAREELTHMNRNRSVEGPLDIRVLDYSRGDGLVFDKGGRDATKGPLIPPVPGKSLGSRRILGFKCEGKEYQWTTFQQAKVRIERWAPQDTSFKVPLLRVGYFTDDTGALLALTVEVVTQLEPVPNLPASLFEAPAGLHVVNLPSVE